jgi:hypothetical protein
MDVFSSTPRGGPSPFRQTHFEKPVATFQVAEDEPEPSEPQIVEELPITQKPLLQKPSTNFLDSGYHGSQMYDATQPTQLNEAIENALSPRGPTPPPKDNIIQESPIHDAMNTSEAEERRTTEGSFQSAKEEQTRNITTEFAPEPDHSNPHRELQEATRPVLESPLLNQLQPPTSPQKRSPERRVVPESPPKQPEALEEPTPAIEDEPMEDVRSPSEGSSPIRPIVRKSSLNFASLPARECLANESVGSNAHKLLWPANWWEKPWQLQK